MPTEAKEYKQPYIENIDVAGIIQGGEEIQTTSGAILPSQGSTTEEGRGLPLGEFTELTVGAGDKIFRVSKKGLWLGAPAFDNAPFKVTPAGVLNASNATLSGSITATSGAIGGFAIGATTLTGGTTNIILDSSNKAISINSATFGNKGIQLEYNSGTPRTYIGDGANQYFKFSGTKTSFKGTNAELTEAGVFTASNAVITGTITATAGVIGGFSIYDTYLVSPEDRIKLDSANTLIRVGKEIENHIILKGDTRTIQSSNYASGVSGFSISPELIEAENLHARGKLSSVVFQYDVIQALGGQLIVANADKLENDMTSADDCTLTISGDTTFAVNDILRIKDRDDEEYMKVTDISGAPTYVVTRDLANAYATNSNPAWEKGTAVVIQGNSDGVSSYSGGWLEMLGSGLNSPYYSVIKRTGVDYNAFQQVARFGNLHGFLDYSSDEYGIAIGDSSRYFTYDPSQGIRLRSTKGDYVIEIMTNPLKIKLNDGTYDRIVIGETASNVYGIEIRSPSGVTMFDVDNNDQKISTSDGKTYWDLKNGRFIVNDGITDRVLIGRLD